MLRGDNIVCGTSTTSTGTLTLAATPSGIGAIDPYVAFSGMGLGTSNGVPVPYTIIEYNDTTWAVIKQLESGTGLLTIGANIGATTLARTTVMNTDVIATPAYNFNAPSAINIGTAANVLVLIGPNAWGSMTCSPWYDATSGDALGITGRLSGGNTSNTTSLVSGTAMWFLVTLEVPILCKRLYTRVSTAYTSATSNLYGRIYAKGSNGRAGKLICDYGGFGTAGSALNATGNISTGAASNPPFLCPGPYWVEIVMVSSGTSGGPPVLRAATYVNDGGAGTTSLSNAVYATSTGESSSASDPASFTAYTLSTGNLPPLVVFTSS